MTFPLQRTLTSASALLAAALALACSGEISDNNNGASSGSSNPTTLGPNGEILGTDEPNGIGWSTRFPKLSNQQWENTVQDLFFLSQPTGLAESFLPEPGDGGYQNQAAAQLTIAGDSWTRYQQAAEQVADLVTGDSATLSRLVPAGAPSETQARARATIEALGLRGYRRPLTAAEVDKYVALFDTGASIDSTDPFASGMNQVIQTLLQSPHFLYRVESTETVTTDRIYLGSYEVATRLSYALWNTMPSDELLAAAGAGELTTPDSVKSWAINMLNDARATATLRAFHEQTYHTYTYGTQSKEASYGFDSAVLSDALRTEADLFFDDVVAQGGGIRQILTSPTAFVNEQTAPFYGISGISGMEHQRVDMDTTQRMGLFSQLGHLAQTGGRTLTDPVHRGLTILQGVLCDDPDPPPAMVPTPVPAPGKTTREIYEAGTACGKGCHDTLINPPGFAFEHFDTVGRWRDDENGLPINAADAVQIRVGWTQEAKKANEVTLLEFDGAVDLLTQLAEQPRVHECYTRKLLTFALAREISPMERGAGALLRDTSLTSGSVQDVLTELVTLDTFRARVVDEL